MTLLAASCVQARPEVPPPLGHPTRATTTRPPDARHPLEPSPDRFPHGGQGRLDRQFPRV